MNSNKLIWLALVAVLIVGFIFPRGNTVVQQVAQTLGASGSGQSTTSHQYFGAGATLGGNAATSSTAATYTTSALDFNQLPTVIQWTPNINTTISLSSTSTYDYVPNIGDSVTVYIRNASSTAAASMTFAAADANSDLQFAEATGGDLVLTGLDWEKMTIIRTSRFLTTYILDEMTEAD